MQSSVFADRLFRMISGSSQGMIQSMCIAVAAFLHSKELAGPGLAGRKFQSDNGVLFFDRYIDNMFFILDPIFADDIETSVQILFDAVAGDLAPYAIQIEEFSRESIAFLDVQIYRPDSGFFLAYRPTLRDNGQLLAVDSMHPSSIPVSWPLAFIYRIYNRISDLGVFAASKLVFLNRLRCAEFPDFLIEHFDLSSRYILPHTSSSRSSRGRRLHLKVDLWAPMPYHPLWRKHGLAGFVAGWQQHSLRLYQLQEAFQSLDVPRIRCCWKLDAVPHGSSTVRC